MYLANQVSGRLSRAQLAAITHAAAAEQEWPGLVRYTAGARWYQRIQQGDSHEVWLLSWLPGQGTGFHDHCGSSGAFTVVLGELRESALRAGRGAPSGQVLGSGVTRSFGPQYVHEVVNTSATPAVSIHAYSPPLAGMRRYELTPGGLMLAAVEAAGECW